MGIRTDQNTKQTTKCHGGLRPCVSQTSSTQTTLCHTHMSLNVILESRRVAMRTISLQKPLLGPPRNQRRHETAGITRRRVACMLAPRSIWCRCDDYNCSLQCNLTTVSLQTVFVLGPQESSWEISVARGSSLCSHQNKTDLSL
uniref:Uncharacterized protein n=1 Tax=Branchiostoma floridae TaxID=7739 RepID=C3Y4U5_BRAFL|eukprot:XP_002608742.1 hypothetical protein BRAFLDRAFT_120596 [Branchiostoma floridae]